MAAPVADLMPLTVTAAGAVSDHDELPEPYGEQSSLPTPLNDQLRLAVAAYLARCTGLSRNHTESDLRCFLTWCAEHGLDPLAARRPHLELYIRWMQEVRRFKPSTVSRRFSVTAGFYRTCVIDGIVDQSPAEHVRRPPFLRSRQRSGSRTCSSRPCSPQPASHQITTTSRWWRCSGCSACVSSKLLERTSATWTKSTATGCCAYAVKAPRWS